VLAGLAAAVVHLSGQLIAPPRPRISESARPTIGLTFRAEGGALIVERAAGPSHDAGVRAGDRIVAVDDVRSPTEDQLVARVRSAGEGGSIRMELRRGRPPAGETTLLADVKVVVRPVSPADAGLPYEDVTFRNAEGLILRGWYVPPGAKGIARAPAIAWGHGNAADRRHWYPVAPAVHEAGIAQLLFDFTGRGDSDGDVITLGAHEAADLRSALDALAARSDVDPLRLAVGGRSMGGAAAILEAADDARVKAVVLDSPYADLAEVVAHVMRSSHVPPALLAPLLLDVAGWRASYDPGSVRPIAAMPRVRAPVLLFQGDADRVVPFDNATRLSAAARTKVTLVTLSGLDHNTPRPDDYPGRVASFLAQALGN